MQGVVFTGGSGAGKTAVLQALRTRGFATVDDTARSLIQARREAGLTPRPSPAAFAEAILAREIENYRRWTGASGYVFFDRGVLDAVCLLDQVAPVPARELEAYLASYRYGTHVFAFPPWEAIYTQDAERDQTFADAVRVHVMAVQWYQRCGYQVVEVPRLPVDERCTFILQVLTVGVA